MHLDLFKKTQDLQVKNLVSHKKAQVENEVVADVYEEDLEVNKCLAFIWYIGELLFYPAIMLFFYYIFSAIQGVIFISLGSILVIFIPFFPFYLICCLLKNNVSALGSIFCALSVLSVFLIFSGVFFICISPIIGLFQFYYLYFLIFTAEVSPYFTNERNWKAMMKLMNYMKEINVRLYNENKDNINFR